VTVGQKGERTLPTDDEIETLHNFSCFPYATGTYASHGVLGKCLCTRSSVV